MRISVFSFIMLLFFIAPISAMSKQSAPFNPDSAITNIDSLYNIGEVMVQGKSKTQLIREGAYAVNAIDVKSLANMTVTLNDIVGRTTGVKVRTEGGRGSDFDLSVNGMSGNSIRYFIDGMPLDILGTGVNLTNLPVNMVDHVEIYKGVIPASLGADALGGAVNIITNKSKRNFLDVSYGIGSFHTHEFDLNAQYTEPTTGIVLRPTISVAYSKNDYLMKDVKVRNEDKTAFITKDCPRFHDDYLSLFSQFEVGVTGKSWADAFFLSLSYSQIAKELQTGAVQTFVYGMAERNSKSFGLSARYNKSDFLLEGLSLNAAVSHTWDHSQTVDTTYRKYYWDGTFINGGYSEIRGRGKSLRHYKRPMTMVRANLDYRFDDNHSLSFNYQLNRTGNEQYDDVDDEYVPTNDVLLKHVLGLSYNQSFLDGRLNNVLFLKDYINHLATEQTELGTITGAKYAEPSKTQNFLGGGIGSRFILRDYLAVKASYEHSIRLPLSRELLGNGSTIYPNVMLRPESSDNFNLGLFGTVTLPRRHTITYELNGFLRFVDDYIQASVLDQEGMMQYENVEAVHIKGIEGEVRYDWDRKLQLSFNASYQDSRDQRKYKKDGKPSVTYNNRTPNRPWLFSNAEAAYTFQNVGLPESKLRLACDYQWVHWFYLTWEAYGAAKTKARIPTQHVTNASMLYSWGDGRYNVSLECTNLFDKLTYDNYMLQKPGRAFYAKFRLLL